MLRLALLVLPLISSPAGATPAVPATAMPDEIHGTWGADPEACTRADSRGRIRVEARAVQLFHATCTFARIRIVADGIFEGRGHCVEVKGGRRYEGGVSLMGLGDQLMVSYRGSQISRTYHRCARPLPVR